MHKYLLTNLTNYQDKCTVKVLEVNPNFNQEKTIGVPESLFSIKAQRDRTKSRTEFLYILGIPSRAKLEKKLDSSELTKFMIKN